MAVMSSSPIAFGGTSSSLPGCFLHCPSLVAGGRIDSNCWRHREPSVLVPRSSWLVAGFKTQAPTMGMVSDKLVCHFRNPVLPHLSNKSLQMQRTVITLASLGDPSGSSVAVEKVLKSRMPMQRNFPFYVILPPDTISASNTLNHCKAIQAGLLALKALGVDGVVMQVFWGIVERDAPTKYDWSAYLALVKMVQAAGLKVQASICFNGCKSSQESLPIPLPSWVLTVGNSDPDIFFTDRSGNRYKDCLSLAIDSLPLFEGRTPLQMFSDMFQSFRSTFSDYIGNTIVGISVGLGPEGELKYPSFREGMWKFPGVGEFQCYDKYMLANLKQHSEATGHPVWGLGGPHDAPSYSQWPNEGSFFNDNGGSWGSPYGEFFLTWYSAQLIAHGDRILSLAASIFLEDEVIVSGKLPAVHWWHKTKSHAAELTAGFYNVEGRDGYDAFMEMFAKNASLVILPSMDVSEMYYPAEARCSPESVFLQIRRASHKHGVPVAGENSFPCPDYAAFKRITDNVHLRNSPDLPLLTSFTFKSMGASLFFPDHWHHFVKFFRKIGQYGLMDNQSDIALKDQPTTSSSFCNEEQLVKM